MAVDIIKKYIWVISTIYNSGRINLKDLNYKWAKSYISDGEKIPMRTFHNWRIKIEEIFDINIDCDKSTYEYYIENAEDIEKDKIKSWLLNTFALKNLIDESQKLKHRILPEQNPSGQKYLSKIVEAMRDNLVIEMNYQSFWKDKATSFELEPYFVKAFRQRWYVIGRSPYYNKIIIYALDRILDFEFTDKKFGIPEDFDAESFFYNCFGIIADEEQPAETVKIKVFTPQNKYIRALPLHHSQKEIEKTDKYSVFSYIIIPGFDFIQELLSHGPQLEVLSPENFRKKLAKEISKMKKMYDKPK